MKKITCLLLPLLVFTFISCKKSYVCQCNTSWTYKTNSNNYNTSVFSGDKTPYSAKLTKKQAKSACENQQASTETSFTNVITDNNNYPFSQGESVKTDCALIVN